MLFPTNILGSFPQPERLIDRAKLAGRFPPRVRARELWRIPPQYLEEAQNDAGSTQWTGALARSRADMENYLAAEEALARR